MRNPIDLKTIDSFNKKTETIFHLAAAVGVYLIVIDPVIVIETKTIFYMEEYH